MNSYIFKTNIASLKVAANLKNLLPHYFKINEISFDINGDQNILRIKSPSLSSIKVRKTLNEFGYSCEEI
jgi:hypothetical protein